MILQCQKVTQFTIVIEIHKLVESNDLLYATKMFYIDGVSISKDAFDFKKYRLIGIGKAIMISFDV